MSLDREKIKNIAHLARIATSEQEIANLQQDLNNILDFVERMQEVNTKNIEPLSHAHDLTQRLRADKVTEKNLRDEYQKIAPNTDNGLYLVPTVIE